MKTIVLKIKNYGHVNIVNNNNIEARMLNILLSSLTILAFVYVFLLGNMVWNIVERKTAEADARVLGNEVGDLELTYLSMSNKIDLTLANSLGFKETKINFAVRKALGSVKISKNEI